MAGSIALSPSWTEVATSIAQVYVDAIYQLGEAEAAGDDGRAAQLREVAGKTERLLDRYGIGICASR